MKLEKKNKVGKQIYGPFENKETALANWFYYEIENNKKLGIVKSDTFVTKNPNAFFRSNWDSVINDFQTDREAAIQKYGITPDQKIEKKYSKSPKTESETKIKTQNEVTTSGAIEVNQIVYDESNDRYQIEQENQSSTEPEQKSESEQIQQTEQNTETEVQEEIEEPVTPSQTPEEPITESEPIPEAEPLPEIDFSEMMKELSQKPVQRYQREYLQDYIKQETIPEPVDETTTISKIENPDEKDSFGQTLLMKAAKAGNEWQIKALINSGANVNLQDKDGWTALMYAVRYQESLSSVKLLLNANADVKIKNNYDSSAIILAACYNNNPELIKTLLNYYPISDKEILKSFILILSTKHNSEYIQIAKLNVYLDKSIPLNNFYDGKTPLMYATNSGNSTKIIKMLIDHGAATNLRSTEGKTAFDYALENKSLPQDEIYWSLNKK